MLSKDMQDVVAGLRMRAVKHAIAAEAGGLAEDDVLRAEAWAAALYNAAAAIESGEFIGASGEEPGNVVTFTIPDVPGMKLRAVREIREVLSVTLAQAKCLAEESRVECVDSDAAAELAKRLRTAGVASVRVGASGEVDHV